MSCPLDAKNLDSISTDAEKIKHRDRDGGSQSKLIVSFSSGGVAPGVSLLFAFCVFFKALLQSS